MSAETQGRRARICFYGIFGQGNLGNECTLQAILHHARLFFPQGEFTCICTGPADTSRRHEIPAVPISWRYERKGDPVGGRRPRSRLVRWLRRIFVLPPAELLDWVRAYRTLKGIDLLIVPGTGLLTDACTSPLGWPYDVFKWSLIAKLRGCRLAYVSVGAGPVARALSRWFIRSALSMADFRSYRDESTRDHLKGLGFFRHADRVCPDLAFSLPQGLTPEPAHDRRRPIVIVGLMSHPGQLSTQEISPAAYRAYLLKLAVFCNWLISNDYEVRTMTGDLTYDKGVTEQFREILRDLAPPGDDTRLAEAHVSSVGELLSALAAADLVIATRFHNTLLALALNKPVIAVAFHHKSVSLMGGMGLSRFIQDMSDLNVDLLIEQFAELRTNTQVLKLEIGQRTDEYRRIVEEQYAAIFSLVRGQARRTGKPYRPIPA